MGSIRDVQYSHYLVGPTNWHCLDAFLPCAQPKGLVSVSLELKYRMRSPLQVSVLVLILLMFMKILKDRLQRVGQKDNSQSRQYCEIEAQEAERGVSRAENFLSLGQQEYILDGTRSSHLILTTAFFVIVERWAHTCGTIIETRISRTTSCVGKGSLCSCHRCVIPPGYVVLPLVDCQRTLYSLRETRLRSQ